MLYVYKIISFTDFFSFGAQKLFVIFSTIQFKSRRLCRYNLDHVANII